MTDYSEPPQSDVPTQVKVIWVLFLVSYFVGITSIIGLVLAYIWRGRARGEPMAAHFDRQIRVFWMAVLFVVIGLVLTLVLIGYLVLFGAIVYFGVMSIMGLVKALNGQDWPR